MVLIIILRTESTLTVKNAAKMPLSTTNAVDYTITCNTPIVGKTVKVTSTKNLAVAIYEITVYGKTGNTFELTHKPCRNASTLTLTSND